MDLNLRPANECKFDAVSLGEVMLRLDPGEGRIRTARSFRAWEGGGEYNVVRGLRRCFGMKTGVITAFADNEVGKLMEDFILQGGVDTSLIKWMDTDGIGRVCRNGINFTERGFGFERLYRLPVGHHHGRRRCSTAHRQPYHPGQQQCRHGQDDQQRERR